MFTKFVIFVIAYCFMYILFGILDNKYKLDGMRLSVILGKWHYVLVFMMAVFYQVVIVGVLLLCTVITYRRFKLLHDAKKWS